MTKYKLTNDDYRFLWLFCSPKDICEEFGDRAHTERTIRRRFKMFSEDAPRIAINKMYSYFEDKYFKGEEIRFFIDEEIERMKKDMFSLVWEHIRKEESGEGECRYTL